MTNILTFSAELTANVEERTISGKIVPAGTGEVGNTSAGLLHFQKILRQSNYLTNTT